jgi:hypothetical protein
MNLATMTEYEVESFLANLEFFTPAHDWSYTVPGTDEVRTYHYEDRTDRGWYAVRDYAGQDGGYETPIGVLSLVDSYGGEGRGDQYWMVLRLTQGDVSRTFKMDGWYASFDGGYYDGPFTEVKPVKKTITVWE